MFRANDNILLIFFIVYMLRTDFNCLNVYWAQNTPEILEKEATIESSPMFMGSEKYRKFLSWHKLGRINNLMSNAVTN